MPRVEKLLNTLPEHLSSSPLLSVGHVALALVLCIVLCFFKLFSRVDSLKQVFHLTKILSAVKEGQQKYCETVYSRSGINHMWILKNSKDLLDNLKSRSFSQVSSIKTFDFSTLYTTLPHDKLKSRLKETIHKAFSHRNYGSKICCVRLQFHIFFKQNS